MFWQIGSSATLGTARRSRARSWRWQSIRMSAGAALEGRAMSSGANVVLATNTVTAPSCDLTVPPTDPTHRTETTVRPPTDAAPPATDAARPSRTGPDRRRRPIPDGPRAGHRDATRTGHRNCHGTAGDRGRDCPAGYRDCHGDACAWHGHGPGHCRADRHRPAWHGEECAAYDGFSRRVSHPRSSVRESGTNGRPAGTGDRYERLQLEVGRTRATGPSASRSRWLADTGVSPMLRSLLALGRCCPYSALVCWWSPGAPASATER